jgi:D-glycero-alpha-D-manno-heptose 1-phosphate guanylyltransferase
MKAIILAGGKGTRLSSVVADVPKPLAPVQGEPFLFILARFLRHHGIEDAVISVYHLSEKFEAVFPQLKSLLPKATLAREPSPLGTGGAVRFACRGMSQEDYVLVMNGDTFFDFDLSDFMRKHASHTALALKEINDISRYGSVQLEAGKIKAFAEKTPEHRAGLIYAGFSIVHVGELLKFLPEGSSSLEQDFFPSLLKAGKSIHGEPFPGRFIDIGVPEDYHFANSNFDFSKFRGGN